MTKPRRYGGKFHPVTPTQEGTRLISTESSNIYQKYVVSVICCVNGHCRNKTCKLMLKPRRYGGKFHPATPTQEQTRLMSTETSNLYKQYAVSDISKTLQIDDRTAQIWGKSHPATPNQEQTRPISTETSNIYKIKAVPDISCVNGHCRNKRCKLMTKPRRYGGKSHPATPTQEQTRPISTETSNILKK